ncbi:hypothetical protein BDV59DRAFT_130124 [Aspergillus ambiguus]|uniref:uncharacterized protein n=1 Tax=Aspergillus ambiguus TaxID=176160 RepID=UPI003CCD4B52
MKKPLATKTTKTTTSSRNTKATKASKPTSGYWASNRGVPPPLLRQTMHLPGQPVPRRVGHRSLERPPARSRECEEFGVLTSHLRPIERQRRPSILLPCAMRRLSHLRGRPWHSCGQSRVSLRVFDADPDERQGQQDPVELVQEVPDGEL